jgi:asparagine synthase (glutamine-hydrolysing)
MCAIAGIAGELASERAVREMIAIQGHRGADGEGFFRGNGVVLGHRRLAILGVGEAGRQPMTSRDGRWTITFNGEIFNYLELKSALGGEWKTGTDTEVLLEACAAWGIERALREAAGMFAFAIWDARENELTLVRDRLGEKPLTYFWNGSGLFFASEMKALAAWHERRLDPEAVDAYLALGFVPAPLAIFRGCRKLPAGHLLRLRPGREPCVERWWNPESAGVEAPASRNERARQLRDRIGLAVRQRLRAEVSVALCLSGGIDSSVIAAECSRQGANLRAFTVQFDGDRTDLPFARSVAERLGLPLEVLEVSPPASPSEFLQLHWHYDEPFADSSAVPAFALARAVARTARVVLNGDGGDETFAGYPHYECIAVKQMIKRAAAAGGLVDGRGAGRAGVYVQSKALFRSWQRASLLNGHYRRNSLDALLKDSRLPARGSALQCALSADRQLYLANGLNYKTDIAFGSFGAEARAPLLDHRLIEWAQSLPASDLVQCRQKKILLRQAYASELPAEVLSRPKQGFGAPISRWLEGPLRELAGELLPCPLLDPKLQQACSGQKRWAILAFAAWAHTWRALW